MSESQYADTSTSTQADAPSGDGGGGGGSMLGWGQLALTAGMGIMSIFAKNEEAERARYQAQVQAATDMSNRNWGVLDSAVQALLKNVEISRINQARFRQNREIQRAAVKTRAFKERMLRKDLGSQIAEINNGLHSSIGKQKAMATGRGLTTNSGTYKALNRALQNNTAQVMTNIQVQGAYARENINQEYETMLGSRDLFSYNMPHYFVPGQATSNVDPGGMSFLQGATAGLSGVAGGLSMLGDVMGMQADQGASPDAMTW